MTREEAIARIKDHKIIHKMAEPRAIYISEAFDMAIKALEQEPILNKIRAEIKQTTSRYCISRERGCSGQVEWSDRLIKESEVLEIIDKYKAESEDGQ